MKKNEKDSKNIEMVTKPINSILVVEDDDGLNNLIQKSLQKMGFTTIGSINGRDCINKIMEEKNQLLLLDYILPDMTGKQVIDVLNDRDHQVPFIIMTGHGDEKIAVEMMKLGARDYIVKDSGFLEILPQVTKRVIKEIVREKKLELALQMLRDSEEKYRTITENTNDVIYSTDPKGLLTYISPQIKKYGLSPDDIISKRVIDFIIQEDRKRIKQQYNKISVNDKKLLSEFRVIDKEGNIHWLEEHSKVMKDDYGNITGVNGVLRDITERKNAEQEIKKLNEELEQRVKQRTEQLKNTYEKLKNTREKIFKTQKRESLEIFTLGVARNFTNMLNNIQNSILKLKSNIDEHDNNFQTILNVERNCHQAMKMVKQLYTFSKLTKPNKEFISIEDTLVDTISYILDGSRINWEISIPNAIDQVEIDENQFKQVIINLINNAVEATNNCGFLNIHAENIEVNDKNYNSIPSIENAKYVKVSIEDNGPGISSNNIHKIFEPFYSTKNNCNGLGLAISDFIIKNHQGYITADSVVGVGTTFSIFIPVENRNINSDRDSEVSHQKEQNLKRILVMDDEKYLHDSLSETLNKIGYETVFAKDGAETIELFKKAKNTKEPFDAVIIDQQLTGSMACRNAMQSLCKIDPKIYAIVANAYENDPILTNYNEFGFKGIISKPYDIGELNKAFNEVFKINNDSKKKNISLGLNDEK